MLPHHKFISYPLNVIFNKMDLSCNHKFCFKHYSELGSCSGLHQCVPHITGPHQPSTTFQLLDSILWIHERPRGHEHRGQKAWELLPRVGVAVNSNHLTSPLGWVPLQIDFCPPLGFTTPLAAPTKTNDIDFLSLGRLLQNADLGCGLHEAAASQARGS